METKKGRTERKGKIEEERMMRSKGLVKIGERKRNGRQGKEGGRN